VEKCAVWEVAQGVGCEGVSLAWSLLLLFLMERQCGDE
jgi:hypothetical protein